MRTSIGDNIYDFQCKRIEETDNGFILKECQGQEDSVFICNAPILITHNPIKKSGIGGGLVG